MPSPRVPPINCLLSFEALASLRSEMKAAHELSVTPSAISHRIRQLETHLSQKLLARGDFSPTTPGRCVPQSGARGLAIAGKSEQLGG